MIGLLQSRSLHRLHIVLCGGASRYYSGQPRRISKLLIANRGEIACRIIKTAKSLGIKTVAVYSDADANSMHVSLADEAFHIGKAPSQESYLLGDRILSVMQRSGAQAVHPGYGFLSENAEFAEMVDNHDLIFIGPPPSAIRDMGIKSKAKTIMEAAGVPVITGYHGNEQAEEFLKSECDKIGYPVMLKAVRGGGGKGMRICETAGDFTEQLASAKREAMKSFGNDEMIVEKYVSVPRHVEVQVFGDQHNNYVFFWERDCSVQRRHQKIIEEAPAPGLSTETRMAIGEAATRAAAAVNYTGAGTVEFIMDKSQNFYFMEMNTRLQVEHPVSEMITGQDFVEWQIRVAQGEQLPLIQEQIPLRGHSFEARIYAENPRDNFMPGAGHLSHIEYPEQFDNSIRIETGVRQGDDVTVYYDPMIAKLVVWDQDRPAALSKLHSALGQYHIAGLQTNVEFLKALCEHPKFQAAELDTDFIANYGKDLFATRSIPTPDKLAQLIIGKMLFEISSLSSSSSYNPNDPFSDVGGFRLNSELTKKHNFLWLDGDSEKPYEIEALVTFKHCGGYKLFISSDANSELEFDYKLKSSSFNDSASVFEFSCDLNDSKTNCKVVIDHRNDDTFCLFLNSGEMLQFRYQLPKWRSAGAQSNEGSGGLIAPMPGVVDNIFVEVGQVVKEHDPLLVMTAMKMEYVIKAPVAGTISQVLCQAGKNVPKGMQLVVIS